MLGRALSLGVVDPLPGHVDRATARNDGARRRLRNAPLLPICEPGPAAECLGKQPERLGIWRRWLRVGQ